MNPSPENKRGPLGPCSSEWYFSWITAQANDLIIVFFNMPYRKVDAD
jgi:hypothetical protein